ncbi:MAG TPA: hypothetical protein VMT86_15680 [Bryobacteraceae bacterium]|nr:hypothetical protein [Bryobacteraceae bacterium]
MCSLKCKSALLAGALLLASAACSRSHTVRTSDGTLTYKEKGKDSGTISVTGKDGKTATLTFNQNKLPDDYPKDIPIYSGSKVVMSQSVSENHTHNLMLETEDSSDKVVDFYKKGLDGNGWTTESTLTTPQMTILAGTKEQRHVMVQIGDSGAKRSIMQVVSDKQ